MKEFFGIGGYTREPEGYMSWQHLVFVTSLMIIMTGLAIFLGFLVAILIFADKDIRLMGMLLGCLIIVVLGIFDDRYGLPALLKLVVQIVAALIPIACGVKIEFITHFIKPELDYIELGVWSIPITVFWIVLVTNAVNLIDGLDGLADGISSISAVSLLIIAIIIGEAQVSIILAGLAGACLGFLPYNKNPAQIFMGDTGSTFLGFVLALISVEGLFKVTTLISFVIPFVILGIPIFDTVFAIIRRILKGQNPMTADRQHIHHRLIDLGLSQRQTVAVLYGISAFFGLISVLMAVTDHIIFGLTAVLVGIVLFILFRVKLKK